MNPHSPYKSRVSRVLAPKNKNHHNLNNFHNATKVSNSKPILKINRSRNLADTQNKENEKRRALSNFLVICASYDIIDKTDMQNIIIDFIEQVKRDISENEKINHVEEIVQNISIMLLSGKSFLRKLDKWDTMIIEIEGFSKMNPKLYPSLTNKIVFKFMDLVDDLED